MTENYMSNLTGQRLFMGILVTGNFSDQLFVIFNDFVSKFSQIMLITYYKIEKKTTLALSFLTSYPWLILSLLCLEKSWKNK